MESDSFYVPEGHCRAKTATQNTCGCSMDGVVGWTVRRYRCV